MWSSPNTNEVQHRKDDINQFSISLYGCESKITTPYFSPNKNPIADYENRWIILGNNFFPNVICFFYRLKLVSMLFFCLVIVSSNQSNIAKLKAKNRIIFGRCWRFILHPQDRDYYRYRKGRQRPDSCRGATPVCLAKVDDNDSGQNVADDRICCHSRKSSQETYSFDDSINIIRIQRKKHCCFVS